LIFENYKGIDCLLVSAMLNLALPRDIDWGCVHVNRIPMEVDFERTGEFLTMSQTSRLIDI